MVNQALLLELEGITDSNVVKFHVRTVLEVVVRELLLVAEYGIGLGHILHEDVVGS